MWFSYLSCSNTARLFFRASWKKVSTFNNEICLLLVVLSILVDSLSDEMCLTYHGPWKLMQIPPICYSILGHFAIHMHPFVWNKHRFSSVNCHRNYIATYLAQVLLGRGEIMSDFIQTFATENISPNLFRLFVYASAILAFSLLCTLVQLSFFCWLKFKFLNLQSLSYTVIQANHVSLFASNIYP